MVYFYRFSIHKIKMAVVTKSITLAVAGFCFCIATAAYAAPAPQSTNITPLSGSAGFTTSANNLLSPLSLYNHADIVVKTVILLLLFSSLLSWGVWLAKMLEIRTRKVHLQRSLKVLSMASSLHKLAGISHPACQAMSTIVQNEILQATKKNYRVPVKSINERASMFIHRIESKEVNTLNRGASILATIGAVAPFVGLFGTVWGIMHSFVSIAQMQTTNLSVVAPGIAEALFATALGLVAAIPAVILYNVLSRRVSGYRVLLSDSSSLVMCLLSHDLDELKENSNKFSSVA